MLTVRLSPEIDERLAELARQTGCSKRSIAREAIAACLDDLEDRYLAEERMRNPQPVVWSDAVRSLGLSQEQIDGAADR